MGDEKKKIFNIGDLVFFRHHIEEVAIDGKATLKAYKVEEVREFASRYRYRPEGYTNSYMAEDLIPAEEWEGVVVEHLADLLKTYKDRIKIVGLEQPQGETNG